MGAVGRIPDPVQESLGSGLVSDLVTAISKMEHYTAATWVKTEGDSQPSPQRQPPATAAPPQRTLCRPEYTESEKPLNPQRYLDMTVRLSMEDFDAQKKLPDCYLLLRDCVTNWIEFCGSWLVFDATFYLVYGLMRSISCH